MTPGYADGDAGADVCCSDNVANHAGGSPGPVTRADLASVARHGHRPDTRGGRKTQDTGLGFFDDHHKCSAREHDVAHADMDFFVTNLPRPFPCLPFKCESHVKAILFN